MIEAADQEIKRLRAALRAAGEHIIELRGIIDAHVRAPAMLVCQRVDVGAVTTIDDAGMRTKVSIRPMEPQFYLAEPLEGWSEEHMRAFHKMVVKQVGNLIADDVAASIWASDKGKGRR